jgi:hypothetical protein
MSFVDWEIKGIGVNHCNCAWGCPCQFNAMPTQGFCEAVGAVHIDKGHFGKVKLDGLNLVIMAHWPEAIHMGNGSYQVIVDERADDAQRKALDAIAHGRETQEFATYFNVFTATSSKHLPTLFKRIDVKCDLDGRIASIEVPDLVQTRITPIKNPVTGQEHRVRIDFPHSFEFLQAEVANGNSKVTGDIPLNLRDSHAHLNILHIGPQGLIH